MGLDPQEKVLYEETRTPGSPSVSEVSWEGDQMTLKDRRV